MNMLKNLFILFLIGAVLWLGMLAAEAILAALMDALAAL